MDNNFIPYCSLQPTFLHILFFPRGIILWAVREFSEQKIGSLYIQIIRNFMQSKSILQDDLEQTEVLKL